MTSKSRAAAIYEACGYYSAMDGQAMIERELDALLSAEREANATICERYAEAQETPGVNDTGAMWRAIAATRLAALIRARGES